VSFSTALRGWTEEEQQPQDTSGDSGRYRYNGAQVPAALPQHEQQTTGQSVRAPKVNSVPLDNMLRVVEQIMTELNGAVLEEAKILVITKIVLNLMKQNGH
jgi:hypothetical protein